MSMQRPLIISATRSILSIFQCSTRCSRAVNRNDFTDSYLNLRIDFFSASMFFFSPLNRFVIREKFSTLAGDIASMAFFIANKLNVALKWQILTRKGGKRLSRNSEAAMRFCALINEEKRTYLINVNRTRTRKYNCTFWQNSYIASQRSKVRNSTSSISFFSPLLEVFFMSVFVHLFCMKNQFIIMPSNCVFFFALIE